MILPTGCYGPAIEGAGAVLNALDLRVEAATLFLKGRKGLSAALRLLNTEVGPKSCWVVHGGKLFGLNIVEDLEKNQTWAQPFSGVVGPLRKE